MSEKERVSYFKALMYIALADDTIEESEEKYLVQIGNLYGLSEEQISGIKERIIHKYESIEVVLSDITDRKLKLILLYDFLALCYADENYSIVEKAGMNKICAIMEIEKEKLDQMEELMNEQVVLQKKINLILER